MAEQTEPKSTEQSSWFAEYRKSSQFRLSTALIGAEMTVAGLTGAFSYLLHSRVETHYQPFADSIEAMLPVDPISKNQLDDLQMIVNKEKNVGLKLDPRSRVSEMVGSYDTYPQHIMKAELRSLQESTNHAIDDFKDLRNFSLGLSVVTLALVALAARRSYQLGKEKLY